MLEGLEKRVLRIIDENGNNIQYECCEIKPYKHKYSSADKASPTLFIDGIPVTGKKKTCKYKVEFVCECGNTSTTLLFKYLNKTKMTCLHCRENEEKTEWHKELFRLKRLGIVRGNKEKPQQLKIFENESPEFKENYFKRNLTPEEFNRAKPYIYSINGVVLENKKVEFIIADSCNNGKRYSQSVVIDGIKHKLTDVCLKCPLCGQIFHITRQLKERVISNNFDCKECYLVNNTFKVRKYSDSLTYQSKPELTFIEMCKANGIEITNGDKVEYVFDGKKHKYSIDFYLPQKRMQVEIKGDHVWHKNQIKSGKWKAKETAAIEYCKSKNQKFVLLFSNNFNEFFNHERDSLTIGENQ